MVVAVAEAAESSAVPPNGAAMAPVDGSRAKPTAAVNAITSLRITLLSLVHIPLHCANAEIRRRSHRPGGGVGAGLIRCQPRRDAGAGSLSEVASPDAHVPHKGAGTTTFRRLIHDPTSKGSISCKTTHSSGRI